MDDDEAKALVIKEMRKYCIDTDKYFYLCANRMGPLIAVNFRQIDNYYVVGTINTITNKIVLDLVPESIMRVEGSR